MRSDRIRSAADVVDFISRQPSMMMLLRQVESLGLPDCWIGAGFIRNSIWDALHDRPWSPSYTDVDIVYYAPEHLTPDCDSNIEKTLSNVMPGIPWSVKNQARMHIENGDAPYCDTADALRHWPEVCTAVAARKSAFGVEMLAPFGVTDLVGMIVRPTPAFAGKMDAYRNRFARKGWSQRWPKVRILEPRHQRNAKAECD